MRRVDDVLTRMIVLEGTNLTTITEFTVLTSPPQLIKSNDAD